MTSILLAPSPVPVAPPGRSSLPAFGHLSSTMRDTMYPLQKAGFVYTSAWVCSPCTSRHAAVLLLSAPGRPFVLQSDNRRVVTCAAFVPPLVARSLEARDVGLVSINVTPGHPAYGTLRRLGGDEIVALDASSFDDLRVELSMAYQGALTLAQARSLMDRAVAIWLSRWPAPTNGLSPQQREVFALVEAEPALALPDFAERLSLSYDRASHVLRDTLGLSLKSYQCWRKMAEAAEALMTEASMTAVAHAAGFCDSAHLSRSFRQQLGLAPSYLRRPALVRVVR